MQIQSRILDEADLLLHVQICIISHSFLSIHFWIRFNLFLFFILSPDEDSCQKFIPFIGVSDLILSFNVSQLSLCFFRLVHPLFPYHHSSKSKSSHPSLPILSSSFSHFVSNMMEVCRWVSKEEILGAQILWRVLLVEGYSEDVQVPWRECLDICLTWEKVYSGSISAINICDFFYGFLQ